MRMRKDVMVKPATDSIPLYGPQTELAQRNFDFGGGAISEFPLLIKSLAAIKSAAAKANASLDLIGNDVAEAIVAAANEMSTGTLDRHLIVDAFESSGGTSTNMNVNEVLARRAAQLLALPIENVHPNDVVNLGQSTNDVIPIAIKMASHSALLDATDALHKLSDNFFEKSKAYAKAYKLGRTCLQDAQPMTYGQTFGAWGAVCKRHAKLLADTRQALLVIPLGATAIGTGLGAHPDFKSAALAFLAKDTGFEWSLAVDPFDALSNSDVFARVSAEVRNAGQSLGKIGNDLQLLSSGPVGGIGEIRLPPCQSGSSIMPGKINPVMPMALCQLGFILSGYDAIVSQASQQGQLEINPYEPVIGAFLLRGIDLLTRSVQAFDRLCARDLSVDQDRALSNLRRSAAIATAFVPKFGYDGVTALVREATALGESFGDVICRRTELSEVALTDLIEESVGQKGTGND